jgi:hypothetical protein
MFFNINLSKSSRDFESGDDLKKPFHFLILIFHLLLFSEKRIRNKPA